MGPFSRGNDLTRIHNYVHVRMYVCILIFVCVVCAVHVTYVCTLSRSESVSRDLVEEKARAVGEKDVCHKINQETYVHKRLAIKLG